MARPMKIYAVCDDSGLTTVKVLIRHDMETGFRKNKDGTLAVSYTHLTLPTILLV